MPELDNNHLSMLRAIARKYQQPGIEFDDLYSEACLIVLKKLKHYDPLRGSMNTFLYTVVKHHLLTYVMSRENGNHHQPMPQLIDTRTPDQSLLFESKLKALHLPARKLCGMILLSPDKYLAMNLDQLTQHLKQSGWSWQSIRSAFKEIKSL